MRVKPQKFRVAAVQPEMVAGSPDRNSERALRLARRAAARGAKIIVLPELFITGFDYECIERLAARSTEAALRSMRAVAREFEIVIVAGSVSARTSGRGSTTKIFNVSHIIGPDGRTKASYRKMHLFPLMDEDMHLSAGTEPVCARTPYGTIAQCICFDIRFPELVRRLMQLGADLLAVPAEFPRPRMEHWRTLLRARALENQFFVIAANRVGNDATGSYFGHSLIIDPNGEIVAEAGEEEEILMGYVDLGEIEATRRAIPCLDRINPAVRIAPTKKRGKK